MIAGWTLGCGAERLNAGLDAGTVEPPGSGGAAVGTGGAGSGGDGTGGDGTGGAGTGGDGTGSGGVMVDMAPDTAPMNGDDARDVSTEPPPSPGDTSDGALEGHADAARDAAACVNGTRDLSSVGTGDFHISFRVATIQTGWVALLNQRSMCFFDILWDIREAPDGTISVELDDGTNANYRAVKSPVKINDGNLHDIEVSRVAGMMTIQIDGASTVTAASAVSLGMMPALRIGTDVCGPASNPSTAAFAGKTLTDVCIIKR
ncbi:MAG TPA: hypothetical protein VNO55_21185 [Polyangia bacterium]|nr:hypothetical protein [Polyangia bacterium]